MQSHHIPRQTKLTMTRPVANRTKYRNWLSLSAVQRVSDQTPGGATACDDCQIQRQWLASNAMWMASQAL